MSLRIGGTGGATCAACARHHRLHRIVAICVHMELVEPSLHFVSVRGG